MVTDKCSQSLIDALFAPFGGQLLKFPRLKFLNDWCSDCAITTFSLGPGGSIEWVRSQLMAMKHAQHQTPVAISGNDTT